MIRAEYSTTHYTLVTKILTNEKSFWGIAKIKHNGKLDPELRRSLNTLLDCSSLGMLLIVAPYIIFSGQEKEFGP